MNHKLSLLVVWSVALTMCGFVASLRLPPLEAGFLAALTWTAMLSGAIYGIDADRADQKDATRKKTKEPAPTWPGYPDVTIPH